jgi:vancomycin resistance protein YoaR
MSTVIQRGLRGIALLSLLLLGAALGIGVAAARDAATYAGRIYPGITIGGNPMGGLSREEAAAALRPIVERRLRSPLTVRLADREATFTHGELGLSPRAGDSVQAAYALGRTGPWWQRARSRIGVAWRGADLPLRFDHDPKQLHRLLAGLASELDATPQSAQVTVREGAAILVAPSRPGQSLDVEATAARVLTALDARAPRIDAAVSVVEPEFTTEEARDLRALLATYTTKMAANPNRTHNISLASGFVRGTILEPDGVFSYNKVVGPRTLERGFKEAPVLVDDELVPGDGGGICQVSSTLFNVALLADFKILTRTNHSRPVAYLPAGRDATVVYGALDLLFRNTTGRHVLLWTEVRGNRLTISAYGTPPEGTEVLIEVADRREIPPPEGTVTKEDPELPAGTVVTRDAQPGLRVKTYRVVKVGGVVVRREYIGGSYYRPVPRTIKVGTKRLDASQPRP